MPRAAGHDSTAVAGRGSDRMLAFIGLGSNLGDAKSWLQQALARIESHRDIELSRVSGFYLTTPWGLRQQDDFVNAVAEIKTALLPLHLLDVLQAIEHDLGRSRSAVRWGPRNIDLDLLSYGLQVLHSPRLVLPHPRMHLRAFVLVPLLELAPDWVVPGRGSAQSLLQKLSAPGVRKLE